ncbi:hypothetical protein Tco_1446583 [Tanacetum coccineum]
MNKQSTTREITHEALKKDIYERIMILQEPRPIIETNKFIDQHKKLLDSVMLDRLKLDGEIKANEEEATKEIIKGYKTLREKDDPEFLEDAKPIAKKITMLNHSKAEPIGILREVLCQVRVTTILAKFLILDMPINKDVPIVVGRSFLYTCGGIINTIKKTTSTFDSICYQDFYVAAVKRKEEEKDTEDREEYYVKRDRNGKPIYGSIPMNYLNYDDPLDRELALQEALNPFKKGLLNNMGSAEKIEEILEIKVYEIGGQQEIFTSEAWRRLFDINERIYTELCYEFYSTYTFDEVLADYELRTKKVIKFRLGGRDHTLTLLEFARRLGLYHADEVNDERFKVYFQEGLRSDENINAKDYWLSISGEEELRYPILRVLQKMITYGVCQRTTWYDKMQRNKLWLMNMFEAKHQNGYANVAWLMAKCLKRKGVESQRDSMICCGALDAITFKELIGPDGRLIVEDPSPRVPRVAMPRGPRPSMQDLYDGMGNIEIRQGTLERMARRQLYHTDKYAGLFENMDGHYGYTLQGAYAPPGYDEEQQDNEK